MTRSIVKVRTRKRLRNEQAWLRSNHKELRNVGGSYINNKGTFVPVRFVGNNCRYSLSCFQKVSSSGRACIFKEFNDLRTFDIENTYLHGLIHRNEPKQRYTSKGKESRSSSSFVWVSDHEVHVCLKAFSNIHGVLINRIRNVRSKGFTLPLPKTSVVGMTTGQIRFLIYPLIMLNSVSYLSLANKPLFMKQ